MRSILEFALFAWVGISIVAVLVQLIRIARYKRANGSTTPADSPPPAREAPTIDLAERLASSSPDEEPAEVPADVMASGPAPEASAASAVPAPAPAPATPTPTAVPAPVAASPVEEAAAPVAPDDDVMPATEAAPSETTLADLLAGVRLPWNLLPTVDQSREPSNDRVALMTADGAPNDIGVDVADELERLGFTITPRGDDTAVATQGEYSLGLQIIENPMAAEVDGVRRFPNATESSVALDIWIE